METKYFDPKTVKPGTIPERIIQPKLEVNPPNDKYEQEANQVADKVSRMPGNATDNLHMQPKEDEEKKLQMKPEEEESVSMKPDEEEKGKIQMSVGSSSGNQVPQVSSSLVSQLNSTKGQGSPLSEGVSQEMGQKIGGNFNNVRVHTDDNAVQMNKELGAKAFTHGNDIYFNNGKYNPENSSGKFLLAHELTHVNQQSGRNAVNSSTIISRTPDDDAKATAKKIHDALSGAKVDEKAILDALTALGRDQTKVALLKTTYKTEYSTELETNIKAKLAADVLSKALFLLNAPQAETSTYAMVTVDNAGTEKHKAKVGGGEVTVNTGVDFKTLDGAKYPGGYSVGFSGGSKVTESRFLQTIWSEIVNTQADKSEVYVNKKGLGCANGQMDLTTDPLKPQYKVDSASKTSPFYESAGVSIRTSTGTTIYDRPSEFSDIIAKQFDAGATKVVERDHFDVFLIQEEKAIYHVSLVVEWVYTSKTAVTRTTTFGSGSAITNLPADVKKQVVKEYPKFEYIY
jgi:hypothetical protein